MLFNVAAITSSVAEITFVVAEITFKVVVITKKTLEIVVHFVFNRNKILCIYAKALDSDFQLISKMFAYFC